MCRICSHLCQWQLIYFNPMLFRKKKKYESHLQRCSLCSRLALTAGFLGQNALTSEKSFPYWSHSNEFLIKVGSSPVFSAQC